tara:strand:+ start:1893 stop:2138 length:246 start_codon:yes stop_codon:yes gene_type:complete
MLSTTTGKGRKMANYKVTNQYGDNIGTFSSAKAAHLAIENYWCHSNDISSRQISKVVKLWGSCFVGMKGQDDTHLCEVELV